MKNWIVILLLVGLRASAMGETTSLCAITKINTSLLVHGAPVMVPDVSVRLESAEAVTSFTVEDRGEGALNRVFALIEFRKGSKYLFTSLFFGATAESESKSDLPVPISDLVSAQLMISAVLPGSRVSLEGINFVRPLQCPDSARLTMLQATFSQGPPLFVKASGWRVDPAISNVSPWEMSEVPANSAVLAQLSVDANGKPHLISTQRTEKTSWLGDQISDHWRFLPALYDGKPIATEMWVLFRFFPDQPNHSPVSLVKKENLSAIVFVDVVHPKEFKGSTMYYMGDAISVSMNH